MSLKRTTFLLSAVCALISVGAHPAGKQVIKEYTTPPAPAEALPVTAIPPLSSAASKVGPTAPAPTVQNVPH